MNVGVDLETRIERLEEALREIDARLDRLEHHRPAGARPRAPAELLPEAPAADGNALGLAGICSLILGGAFVLRAMTESQMLPRLAGAVLGLAYAAFWIWNADRLARKRRPRSALFYAITAALIAFPLVWETTVRFRVVPATVAGITIGILGLLFLWAAVRSNQQLLAWTGSIASIAAAFAIGPSAEMLISITAIGIATAIAAKEWEFAPWPLALASNIIALILIVTHPRATLFALIAYAVLWAGCAVLERARHDITVGVQATIALLVGIGGATFLLLRVDALALVWCAAGLIAAVIAWRMSSRAIAIQSVIWILAASVSGGLLLSTGGAFIEGEITLPPAALATGITALIAYFLMHPPSGVRADASGTAEREVSGAGPERVGAADVSPTETARRSHGASFGPWRGERVILFSLFLCMLFTGVMSVLAPMVTHAALLRTALLAVAAALLAIIGRGFDNREASILARVLLVIGGLKLIAEDLRVGSAAILVIAFALYGAALMVVSRSGWARNASA